MYGSRYTNDGKLVPDGLVLQMVADALQSNAKAISKGWLLDGFPRTAVQADAMRQMGLKADIFILIDVPDSVLVDRICNRRTDPASGKIYNLKFKPPPAALLASGTLVQRGDDTKVRASATRAYTCRGALSLTVVVHSPLACRKRWRSVLASIMQT